MPAQRVRAGEAPATAPVPAYAQLTAADELLLAAVKTLVALAVVLAGERFAADGAHKGALVGVRAQVGAQVVGSREALRAEVALERGRVLLDAPLGAAACGAGLAG